MDAMWLIVLGASMIAAKMAAIALALLSLYVCIHHGIVQYETKSYIKAFMICVYRLTCHPLSSYPGPVLAKITNLYAAYHAWKGDIHVDMWKCHQRYDTLCLYSYLYLD